MTDPQTAADAAERNDVAAARVEAWLEGYNPILPKAAVRSLLWERAELLAERARMAAELEQVRGERDALQHLYDGREDDEPHACNGGGIMPCSICGEYTPDVEAQKRFQVAVAADMERARQTGVLAEIEAWEDAETVATRPAESAGNTEVPR